MSGTVLSAQRSTIDTKHFVFSGSIIVHGMVMNHTVMSHIPNTYTGLAPVDLSMIIPKTGLAVNIPKMAGGVDLKLVLPR